MTLKKFGGSVTSLNNERVVEKALERANSIDLSTAAYRTLMDACRDDRLVFGVDCSAKFLMADPDSVFACLLPLDGYQDITTQIYYKLLEAYCNENDIPLIQVDSSSKLVRLINENGADKTVQDCTVILIRRPDTTNGEEESISEYEKEMARCVYIYQKYARPIPAIVLPQSVD